jgi:adenine-specific DNA-methyltransferase
MTMSQNLERLKQLLAEMFQLDQAELDFGIYRIMNAKREEITRFLDNDLLPQVRKVLGAYESESREALAAELEKAKEQAKALGFSDPSEAPKVKELQARYDAGFDLEAAEQEVFSHLYDFFRRYYHEGDFISLRRYKEGVYAIPYEGEEVKLYWANHDQYYIKTSEYLRNYTFKLPSGRRVHFKLVEADTEKDNNRATNGNERRFILSAEQPLAEENGELVIRFEYRPHPDKKKQAELNAEAVDRILEQTRGFDDWRRELGSPRPTEKNPKRTLLERHLTDYTARNTLDYFIHKDLGGFLRRELDFYIKNEVMHLDDIENETAPRVEQYLSKIKAIRRIAHKIIDFLAQLENFQKKLWLKKKFVVETQYCITIDRIFAIEDEKTREWLLDEIIKNDAQREEWVRLYGDMESWGQGDTAKVSLFEDDGVLVSLSPALRVPRSLVVDTRYFDEAFKLRLLAAIPDIDEETDGLLIHSENFQALNLLQASYRGQVKCIYIDPPYNTGTDEFVYRDRYQHSSWLAMMIDRLAFGRGCLRDDGAIFISIDDNELAHLKKTCDEVWERIGTFVWEKKKKGSHLSSTFRDLTEYVLAYARDIGKIGQLYGEKAFSGEWQRLINRANKESELTFPAGLVQAELRDGQYAAGTYGNGEMAVQLIDAITVRDGIVQNCFRMRARFKWKQGTLEKELDAGSAIKLSSNMRPNVLRAGQEEKTKRPPSLITKDVAAYEDAFEELVCLFGGVMYGYPKPTGLIMFLVRAITYFNPEGIVLDFFAGSGTTGHAVINLNREDGGRRKFILVEMGEYFDTVLVPRLKKVIFTPEWKDGRPGRLPTEEEIERSPRILKILRLESYEDTLNNLELKRTETQQSLLEQHESFREDYILRYMLDVENRGSPSLLNLDRFEDPFNYTLDIATGSVGETKPTVVDLVETFNYLIGLRVKTVDHIEGVRVVTGTNPQGERVLILWRNTKELDNDKLDAWFRKQGYNTKDQEYDVIYVNGDNNLENLRKPDQTWKVRLIEEEFRRLMFDVQDV